MEYSFDNEQFASNLKELRLQQGYTQEEVAKLCSCRVQVVSTWESQSKPHMPHGKILPLLAYVFLCSINDLFTNTTKIKE